MSPRARSWLVLTAVCASVFGAGARANAQSARPHSVASHAPAHVTTTAHSSGAASALSPEGAVNINTATEDELRRLPGVGPARATAILALRQRVQHFRSADDLLRVRGIGRAGLRRLRPYVALTGDTTLRARPGRAAAHPSAAENAASEGEPSTL